MTRSKWQQTHQTLQSKRILLHRLQSKKGNINITKLEEELSKIKTAQILIKSAFFALLSAAWKTQTVDFSRFQQKIDSGVNLFYFRPVFIWMRQIKFTLPKLA